jgi:hypothetical protein
MRRHMVPRAAGTFATFQAGTRPEPDRIDPKVALPVKFGGDVGML